jgi:predicted ArsR family transcriptional regulator
MNQRLLAEIGRTQRLEIVNSLKRTKGMSVNELVEKMGMSYMGIKQHCLTLQRDGYLDTWRRPQKMGRPEMVYRLAISLLSNCSNRFATSTERTHPKSFFIMCLKSGRRT